MAFFAVKGASPSTTNVKPKLLFLTHGKDVMIYPRVRELFLQDFGGVEVIGAATIRTRENLYHHMRMHDCSFIATSSLDIVKLFDISLEGTQNDNIGYVQTITPPEPWQGLSEESDLPSKPRLILLPPLVQTVGKPEGRFELRHYLNKLRHGTPLQLDEFRWRMVQTPSELADATAWLRDSFLIAVDIETGRSHRHMTSVSYTGGQVIDGAIRTMTYVIPVNEVNYPFCFVAMRELNLLKPPKVMQNGQYDSAYFLRFNAPVYNYRFDTYNMMHAMYPELPQSLAYMSSFFLDNFRFWKDEGASNLYLYNGKDTHNTFWLWLAMMEHYPDYAPLNYCMKFKMVFPCLTCAMEGQLLDTELMERKAAESRTKAEEARQRIDKLLGIQGFNPNSHLQVKKLMKVFSGMDHDSSDELSLIKFMESHPLADRLMQSILDYRGHVKAASNYYEFEVWEGRLFYQLDPSGTETGRMASKASMFWCGTQVQNIPAYARDIVKAEEGWSFAGVDKSQSESYCTGFISQDPQLITNVTTSPDFHCSNASMFFGIPFEELYDAAKKKVLRKDIRKLSKPINHGANYNMGAPTLVDTIVKQMGSKAIRDIGQLLRLPATASLTGIAQACLDTFDRTYKRLRSIWYKEIIEEVVKTGKLVTPNGYTRRTFLKPWENKLHLNACVAHKPQSFSVELVNEAFYNIWIELQLGKYNGKFRLKKQVHDEIVFMATDDIIEAAAQEVADMMVIPTEINGRVMTIPSTIAIGKTWYDCKD